MATQSKISWRREGNLVIITLPKGHEMYPDGKEVAFSSYTPTDMVVNDGIAVFSNNDGITVDTLANKCLTDADVNKILQQFEEAVQVIDSLEQLKQKAPYIN
jgi:hypothetical protein